MHEEPGACLLRSALRLSPCANLGLWLGTGLALHAGMRSLALPLLVLGLLTPASAQERAGLAQSVDPRAPLGASALAYPGRSLPLDVASIDEDPLLASGRRAAIVAVRGPDGRVDPRREPLLVVHGIKADFGDVAPLIRSLGEQTRYQVHVVAYADTRRRTSLNGDDLAALLLERFRGQPLTFVAHSMGGIVVRRALDRLAIEGRLGDFPVVRVLAVDTPWHGYGGPADGFQMSIVRPFMPDGYEDMRARSPMFSGDAGADDPLDRVGLYGVDLPSNVHIHLIAAQSGTTALDYTELPAVAEQLALRLDLEPFTVDDPQVRNLTRAIAQSEVGRSIVRQEVPLTARCVRQALERLIPRLPGDHSSVLRTPEFFHELARFLGIAIPSL
jgi:hypothetical protein